MVLADVVAHRDAWTDLLTLPTLVLSAPLYGLDQRHPSRPLVARIWEATESAHEACSRTGLRCVA